MKILIVNTEFPEFNASSGGKRLSYIIDILLDEGHDLTIIAADIFYRRAGQLPLYRERLEEKGAKCLSVHKGGILDDCKDFYENGQFELAILCTFRIFNFYAPFIRYRLPNCRIIFDTVDIHHVREQREQRFNEDVDPQDTKKKELDSVDNANIVWAITDADRNFIKKERPNADVRIVPNIHERTKIASKSFSERENATVFIGNYTHSPNRDAVEWYINEILPSIINRSPGHIFKIIGSYQCDHYLKIAETNDNVELTGWIPSPEEYFNNYKIAVAPLRFGSGMKGKIGDYLAYKIPCITTSIGAEGFNFNNGEHSIIEDDPIDFANAVVRLENDEDLWTGLMNEGHKYAQKFSPENVKNKLVQAIVK